MSEVTRVYAGRLAGMIVRGPETDAIGRVRDVIVNIRPYGHTSRVLGLVVEMTNKRRIFLPMLRVASIDPHEIMLVSGSVSLRSYKPRAGELAIVGDVIGAKVHVDDPELEQLHSKPVEIADVELERTRTRDWAISAVAVLKERATFARRPELFVVPWKHVHGISAAGVGMSDAFAELLAEFEDMRPADIASVLYDLPENQRTTVATELDDERLADILQEMSEDRQAELLETLDIERAADVLEEMDPDDAADLLSELDDEKADVLLELMDPEESAPVRRLMSFSPDTVGALMTPEPLILSPQTTVAEALAQARNPDLPTSLSSMVFVVRPPTATPTGTYLGSVHLQRLLREPPSMLVSGILDPDLPPLYADDSQETAARYFATYNLVCGPVLDNDNHLLGAVAVDDLLDHLLPEDWRDSGIRPDSTIVKGDLAHG
ncbi:CBS domain-containing protein [Corynebacterium sp. ES2794-CONJ1]|uniref:magnesium transporter MgtE N-terminal domain-containing protein n=1 Tax=unclassified Corynebacterium TaxID=2624378 RepID=UPI002168E639|nr:MULTISPECIES: CBS domain-containing protein [unclassified Corynebacterium]MCS4489867.1 CBS domain-containing protein [Corynebacterium sp. ES2775-CONJ]MCS4491769.1 CBS domain-containing protein [Corynebacterium sp. ES2715-CONJ3]MCS4531874.1 CBS domain-containing protein [Corynebacterium sp. ES2730-CONJ]MCU9519271.1 CBS domain-containing protein [Corynebacterium sp. ES2794-CONJ1]